MEWKKKVLKKLRKNSGETIAETLVALLISALALLMLAGAVSAASSAITKSKKKINEYYKAANSVAGETSRSGGGTVTISGDGINNAAYNVTYYTNGSFSNKPVVSYSVND